MFYSQIVLEIDGVNNLSKMVKTIASKANVGIVIDIYDAITS